MPRYQSLTKDVAALFGIDPIEDEFLQDENQHEGLEISDTERDLGQDTVVIRTENTIGRFLRPGQKELLPFFTRDFDVSLTFALSPQWKHTIEMLCSQTGTEAAFETTMARLTIVCKFCQNEKICTQFQEYDQERIRLTQPELLALLAAVWLRTSLCILRNQLKPSEAVADACGSLLLSFIYVFELCETRLPFSRLVDGWDRKIQNAQDLVFTEEYPDPNVLERFPNPTELRQTRQELIDILDGPCPTTRLASKILEREISADFTCMGKICQNPENSELVLAETTNLFASMDHSVLKSCINGRICRDAKINKHKTASVLYNNTLHKEKPVIYLNGIADKVGVPPTPSQLQQVIRLGRQYVSEDDSFNELAWKIDSLFYKPKGWIRAYADSGLRRYTEFGNFTRDQLVRPPLKDLKRRAILLKYFDALENRVLSDINSGRGHIPMSEGLVEVGYTMDAKTRLEAHYKHRNSNYVMNITQAILEHLYPTLFILHQHILYVCWKPIQAWLGEMMLTSLCDGYITNGIGMSHFPAGYSNSTATKNVAHENWVIWQNWGSIWYKTTQRLELEMQRAEVNAQEVETQRKEVLAMIQAEAREHFQKKQSQAREAEELKRMIDLLEDLHRLTTLESEINSRR